MLPAQVLPQSKQLSRLQRLGRDLCFSSSIFTSSNLRPREASARALEGSEPGGLIHGRGEECLQEGRCEGPWKGWMGDLVQGWDTGERVPLHQTPPDPPTQGWGRAASASTHPGGRRFH